MPLRSSPSASWSASASCCSAIALIGLWLRWRGRLYDTRWFSIVCAFSSPLAFIAILAGWTVTEAGRQPYVVYGHLRTADAVSPVAAGAVGHAR